MTGIAKNAWKALFSALVSLPIPHRMWARLVSIPFQIVSRTTIHWEGSLGLFRVKQGEISVFVARRSRLYWYLLGIERRFRRLTAEYLLESIPVVNRGLAIDVGANIGEMSIIFSKLGFEPLAFEPDPSEHRALARNVESTGTCHEIALSNRDGESDFFLANDSGDSSLFSPASGHTGVQKVTTRTLDNFLDRSAWSDRAINVLKLEAEGAEPEVLEGARRTLRRVEWIVADVGFERGLQAESTLPAVVRILSPLGFDLIQVGAPRLVALFKNAQLLGKSEP